MHHHSTHEMAIEIFEIMSKASHSEVSFIKKKFIKNDYDTTVIFWNTFNVRYPSVKYNRIDVCPDCNKFELYCEPDFELHIVK